MKFIIVFAALFAVALAAPSHDAHDAEIIHNESDVGPESYKYLLETSDGTHHDEEGHLKDIGTEHEANVVHGSYSWVDEHTGEKFTVNYVADENGFQPEGAHLPAVPQGAHQGDHQGAHHGAHH